MACLTVLFLGVAGLALRQQRSSGQRNQWVYVAPLGALLTIGIMILNLNGVVIAGGGGG